MPILVISAAVETVAAGPAGAVATAAGGYVAITPTRLLDTRTGTGAPEGAVGPGKVVTLKVIGASIPAGASAVALTVTVTGPTSSGYITVWGSGTRPVTSNLNYIKGETVANSVITPLASDGTVRLYSFSSGTTQLVADAAGYYTSGTPTQPGTLHPLTPTRLLDTRTGNGAPAHAVARLATLTLKVTGRAGIAAGAAAAVLNVTALAGASTGFITVWGDGARPSTSNLNYAKGQTIPNLVITPIGSDGTVHLYNGSGGTVALLADVSGYFSSGTPTAPGTLKSLAPARLLDTRHQPTFPSSGVRDGATVALPVTGVGGVPSSGVAAVVINLTGMDATGASVIIAFASGTPQPRTSNLNLVKGQTAANLVTAPVSADGKIALYNQSGAHVQLIVDVFGYILGTPQTAWSATQAADLPDADLSSNVEYDNVSCASAGSCAASGFYDRPSTDATKSMLATLSGKIWSQVAAPLPANADPAGSTEIESVSCPTAGKCFAVGYYTDTANVTEGLLETLSGGVWRASSAPVPADGVGHQAQLYALSCTGATSCVATGAYFISANTDPGLILTLSGSSWTAKRAPVPAGSSATQMFLETLSCNAGSCAAAGVFGSSGALNPVLTVLAGGTWTSSVPPVPAGGSSVSGLGQVACPAAGTCVAVGSYPNASDVDTGVIETLSGGWWTARALATDAHGQHIAQLYGLSCPTIAFCAASGSLGDQSAVVATGFGASWTATEPPYPADNTGDGNLTGISCNAAASCTGAGFYYVQGGNRYRAMSVTLSGTTWSATATANPSVVAPENSWAIAISCTTGSSFCAGVGTTTDPLGSRHGLLEVLRAGS